MSRILVNTEPDGAGVTRQRPRRGLPGHAEPWSPHLLFEYGPAVNIGKTVCGLQTTMIDKQRNRKMDVASTSSIHDVWRDDHSNPMLGTKTVMLFAHRHRTTYSK